MHLNHGNALSTFATIAAYEKGHQWLEDMLAYIQTNLSWITGFIDKHLPKMTYFRPEGTYQIWFDFSQLGLSDTQLKSLVFEDAKMGLTPGEWFHATSPQFMRMNFATSLENIKHSFELLKIAIENIQHAK